MEGTLKANLICQGMVDQGVVNHRCRLAYSPQQVNVAPTDNERDFQVSGQWSLVLPCVVCAVIRLFIPLAYRGGITLRTIAFLCLSDWIKD